MSYGEDRLPTSAPPLGTPTTADDWPAQATAQIVKVVDTVRSKTTEPAITVARAVVYGLLAALLASAAAVLTSIMLIRFVDVWVPGDVYWAYLIVGGVFFLIGLVCWLRRSRQPAGEAD